MRKIVQYSFGLLMMICLCMVMTVPAFAKGDGVYDQADLLSQEEEEKLLQKIQQYEEKYKADIAIVTTDDAGGKSAMEYADLFAESIGMSMKADEYPGILFLIDMDNREIYIATQGKAIGWYGEGRIDNMLDRCYNKVIDKDYYGTCQAFLKGVRDYMGRTDGTGARMDLMGVLIRLGIALVAGAVITFSMVFRRGGSITTNASTYLDASASKVEERQDRFINRTVTRRKIPKNNGSSGHGGSGGGMHMSSGGGMHGGGGRSF